MLISAEELKGRVIVHYIPTAIPFARKAEFSELI